MTNYAMNKVEFEFADLDEAWPDADPNLVPFGELVLVQIRVAKKKTKGGLYIPEDVRDTEQWNTQVAKVIAHGPLAFHNRNTGQPWPEGAWAHPGEFVRVPKYGGDSWSVQHGEDEIVFKLFKDLNLSGKIPDPLKMKAFL